MAKYKTHIIVKEEDDKWFDADGNIICVEVNGEWVNLPQYEYDTIDYTQILFNTNDDE
jgi:hypothetical protein